MSLCDFTWDRQENDAINAIQRSSRDILNERDVSSDFMRQGRTPLMLAILANQEIIVKVLLAATADPNISDEAGLSPLMMAASVPVREKYLVLLLEYGAHIDYQPDSFIPEPSEYHAHHYWTFYQTRTALSLAAYVGNGKGIQCLLRHGAKIRSNGKLFYDKGNAEFDRTENEKYLWYLAHLPKVTAESLDVRLPKDVVSLLMTYLDSHIFHLKNQKETQRIKRC